MQENTFIVVDCNYRNRNELTLALGEMGYVVPADTLDDLGGRWPEGAWLLVHDAGPLGLRAIYDRTGMPPRLYPAIRAGLDVYHATEMPHDGESREHFRRVLAERAITPADKQACTHRIISEMNRY